MGDSERARRRRARPRPRRPRPRDGDVRVVFAYETIGDILYASASKVRARSVSVSLTLSISGGDVPAYEATIELPCLVKSELRRRGTRDRVQLRCALGEQYAAFPGLDSEQVASIDAAGHPIRRAGRPGWLPRVRGRIPRVALGALRRAYSVPLAMHFASHRRNHDRPEELDVAARAVMAAAARASPPATPRCARVRRRSGGGLRRGSSAGGVTRASARAPPPVIVLTSSLAAFPILLLPLFFHPKSGDPIRC